MSRRGYTPNFSILSQLRISATNSARLAGAERVRRLCLAHTHSSKVAGSAAPTAKTGAYFVPVAAAGGGPYFFIAQAFRIFF